MINNSILERALIDCASVFENLVLKFYDRVLWNWA